MKIKFKYWMPVLMGWCTAQILMRLISDFDLIYTIFNLIFTLGIMFAFEKLIEKINDKRNKNAS